MIVCGVYTLALVVYLVLRLAFGDGFWWLGLLNTFAHLLFLPLLVFFPLALLIRARGAALRLLPLIVVAGLWFGPYYLPKTPALASNAVIRILTFNIWGDNQRLEDAEAWMLQTDADVILLQEIPESYSTNGVPALLTAYPYQFMQGLDVRVWGNAVLSRYPFVDTENFDLEGDGTPSHQRVALDLGGKTIALYNIHLLMRMEVEPHFYLPINNPFLNMALRYDDKPRNQQIERLLPLLENEAHPFIAAGDFNTSDQSIMYGRLAAQMGDSFREAGMGLGGSWPIPVLGELPNFLPPIFRIDYIWHSDQFQAVNAQVGPRLSSDHLPLLVTLAFQPSA
ncbi:MAG TPA: endonuclease/exonuclease/phosphatase family protein [Phototrophicaceae bacterium]|nr:endonuclease/exonuclease/phosphatase family protein [Phototrophicaceae bacterium]